MDALVPEFGVAEGGGVRGTSVDGKGEASTVGRSAPLSRGVGIVAGFIRGRALSVPHVLDQMPKPTQARKPAMSADRVRRSRFRVIDLFGGAGVEYFRQERESASV
ncbi:hypothetical protein [Nonomuraea sp. NPDC050202]|uniref:hypothetical protein n=1 Tax=Nonomuraea sp. NPDC050202 TaxID=3155035 RepID=UPI0033F89E2D